MESHRQVANIACPMREGLAAGLPLRGSNLLWSGCLGGSPPYTLRQVLRLHIIDAMACLMSLI